jgi:hypothetical protein
MLRAEDSVAERDSGDESDDDSALSEAVLDKGESLFTRALNGRPSKKR